MVCLISALSFAANEIKAFTVPVFETVLSKDSVANDSITSKIEKDSIITSDISNKIEELEAEILPFRPRNCPPEPLSSVHWDRIVAPGAMVWV